ncbi:MAG: hypothetical protein QM535_13075 [Limnohabitans sp.]|nr:hypothetical protein [Limnohabitans sp.]
MENLDNLNMPELLEAIVRIKAETEVIKKEAEKIRQETDDIRKESEAIRQETDTIRKETETIKKEREIESKKNQDKIEKMIQSNLEFERKTKEEQKIMNQHLYSMGITIGFGLEDGMFNLLESNLTLEGIKYDTIQKNVQYHDTITKQTLAEADIILVNGQHAAIIEIKHRLTLKILLDFYNKKVPIIIKNDNQFKEKKIHYYLATASYEDAVIPEAQKLGIGIVEPGYNDIISILKAD